jgi:hypothetical protein
MAWEPHRVILTLSLDVCSEVLFQERFMSNIESGEPLHAKKCAPSHENHNLIRAEVNFLEECQKLRE